MARYHNNRAIRLDDLRSSDRRRVFMPHCPKCGRGGYVIRTAGAAVRVENVKSRLGPTRRKAIEYTIPNVRYCPECQIVYKERERREEESSSEAPYIEV